MRKDVAEIGALAYNCTVAVVIAPGSRGEGVPSEQALEVDQGIGDGKGAHAIGILPANDFLVMQLQYL